MLLGFFFYHLVAFLEEKADSYCLDPLVDRAASLELTQAARIVLHEVEIELADELVEIRLLMENSVHNAHKKRTAVLEEELLGHTLVTRNEMLYELDISHGMEIPPLAFSPAKVVIFGE